MKKENITDFINSYFDSKDHFFITMINHQTNKTTNYHHNIYSFERNFSKILYANNESSIYFTINSFKDEENSFLNDLRECLGVPNSYSNKDIRRLIQNVQKDLQLHTTIQFEFKLVKKGKQFHKVEFIIKNNKKVKGVSYCIANNKTATIKPKA